MSQVCRWGSSSVFLVCGDERIGGEEDETDDGGDETLGPLCVDDDDEPPHPGVLVAGAELWRARRVFEISAALFFA
jgi:hypothetical protein